MRAKLAAVAVGVLALGLGGSCAVLETRPTATLAREIQWQEWSDAIFERARAGHRLVLLHLGAVWCHWCHVMEHTTYEDPTVVSLVAESYLPVRVDADARPDLATRYQDYGWPATVIFDSTGRELARLRGYVEPRRFAELLRAFAQDPTPGPSVLERSRPPASAATLSPELRGAWKKRLAADYDEEHGGWGRVHKYLDRDAVEYGLRAALEGDAQLGRRARATLTLSRKLIDPVWGGVYRSSHGGVWENPHFEKIMESEAGDLRAYSLAFLQDGDPAMLASARDVARYLEAFLSRPDGAFYTSQDADLQPGTHAAEYFELDDAGRRARGLPAIDHHVYARENGWAILGLVSLFEATGDARVLERARTAAEVMGRERGVPGGGFRHDEKDAAGPYLGETLAMGRAFLALFEATSERRWLDLSVLAARFVDSFKLEAGYATAQARGPLAAQADLDENLALARWTNLLGRVAADASVRAMAEHAFRFAVSDGATRGSAAALLLADSELASEPVHVTVEGKPGDPAADALFAAALRLPTAYKIVERKSDASGQPAVFLCAGTACSAPVTTPDAVRAAFDRLGH